MSDSQVLEYVKDGIRQGKEQKQLASELARRGVTKEQATRVKQLYEQQNNVNASNATGTDVNESRLREEMKTLPICWKTTRALKTSHVAIRFSDEISSTPVT